MFPVCGGFSGTVCQILANIPTLKEVISARYLLWAVQRMLAYDSTT
jgi:hypothetical protein